MNYENCKKVVRARKKIEISSRKIARSRHVRINARVLKKSSGNQDI